MPTAIGSGPAFVCPRCRAAVDSLPDRYRCPRCDADYPVCCGIPDFRLHAGPYIGLEDDRRKGEALFREARHLTFAALLRYYYQTTPDDPPDLAERWTAHALAEVEIARAVLRDSDVLSASPHQPVALVDVGCSTGALLIAASGANRQLVGVDVAFRWLVIGQARMREAGVAAVLVCANAEHLPFAGEQFQIVVANDLVEHAVDPRGVLREAHRVSAPGARLLCTSNNRFWPGLEPNVRLWGVGYLPRRWQAKWVAWRRRDLHPYHLGIPSARELGRIVRDAGYRDVAIEAALLVAPHSRRRALRAGLRVYNAIRRLPLVRSAVLIFGPRLRVLAGR